MERTERSSSQRGGFVERRGVKDIGKESEKRRWNEGGEMMQWNERGVCIVCGGNDIVRLKRA